MARSKMGMCGMIWWSGTNGSYACIYYDIIIFVPIKVMYYSARGIILAMPAVSHNLPSHPFLIITSHSDCKVIIIILAMPIWMRWGHHSTDCINIQNMACETSNEHEFSSCIVKYIDSHTNIVYCELVWIAGVCIVTIT